MTIIVSSYKHSNYIFSSWKFILPASQNTSPVFIILCQKPCIYILLLQLLNPLPFHSPFCCFLQITTVNSVIFIIAKEMLLPQASSSDLLLEGSCCFLFRPTLQPASGLSNLYLLPSESLFPTSFFCLSTYPSPSWYTVLTWSPTFSFSALFLFSFPSLKVSMLNSPQSKVLWCSW